MIVLIVLNTVWSTEIFIAMFASCEIKSTSDRSGLKKISARTVPATLKST